MPGLHEVLDQVSLMSLITLDELFVDEDGRGAALPTPSTTRAPWTRSGGSSAPSSAGR